MFDFSALNAAVVGTFGETIQIDGIPVPAIYDSRHYADETGEAGGSDLITTVSVYSTDYPADAAVLVARGKTYLSWEARPDGQGMTVIVLEHAEPSADLDQVENNYIAALIDEEDN